VSLFLAAAIAAVAAVLVELAVPGRAVYHAGWYNVGLSALVILTIAASRRRFREARTPRARLAIVALVAGVATTGIAGAASGLLGPDDQSFVGAPGQRIRVEGLGVLVFPLAATELPSDARVALERLVRGPIEVDGQPRDAGNFILWTSPRAVAYVEARDARGNRLTVTQPAGSAFLSPVLLMQHRQTIAGLDLPFDSFNVPAAHRVVKAVLFTSAQAAMLLHGAGRPGESAVLFAVDDENDRPLPHAIALSAGGQTVSTGGLLLRGTVATYPSVEVVSAPNSVVTAMGTLLALAGLVALVA
jgi:hypothetical protein